MNRQADFEAYRVKYPAFHYDGYTNAIQNDVLTITYHFHVDGLDHFNPVWTIPLYGHTIDLNDPLLDRMIFSLGWIESISYWKITTSPRFILHCGQVDNDQIQWFKKLAFYGLGEFFYVNGISTDIESFMAIQPTVISTPLLSDHQRYDGIMVPLGGGKDSYVTSHIIAKHHDIIGYIINDVPSAIHAKDVLGLDQDHLIHVHRSLDPAMLALNKQGYLNGHTPFSALVAFSSFLCAYIYHIPYIALSNESSANESTIKDAKINHQYSKSIEFEEDFMAYAKKYLTDQIIYFSFLRPLNELQITALFTYFHDYLYDFRSCNVGSKQGVWCGHCAKCCFVAIMLSAFLDDETITSIFGHDMLNDETLWPLYRQLSGLDENKPFECVGTRVEVVAAITLAITKRHGQNLPLALQRFDHHPLPLDSAYALLHQHHETHRVPSLLYSELQDAMKEAKLWID